MLGGSPIPTGVQATQLAERAALGHQGFEFSEYPNPVGKRHSKTTLHLP